MYTTIGSVRGCCGHLHATQGAAERCIDRDQRGCASQGGYSDRRVASPANVTYSERCAIGRDLYERMLAAGEART